MSINVNDKNLGHATAYAYYKAGGGTMTEAEFTEFMADFGTASQTAVEAAQAALASETAAQTAATTATNKATEATTAAQTATTKAGEASTSASTATSAKDTAVSASQTATTKATEATTAAATATSAKTDAVAANTAAQSAKTAAQTAQTGAETAAASVSASAEQIATNAADISQLKSDLNDVNERLINSADNLTKQTQYEISQFATVTIGANILDLSAKVPGILDANGNPDSTGSGASYSTSAFMPVLPSTTYYVDAFAGTTHNATPTRYALYNSAFELISVEQTTTNTARSFTTTAETKYARISGYTSRMSGSVGSYNLMVVAGSAPTSYVAFSYDVLLKALTDELGASTRKTLSQKKETELFSDLFNLFGASASETVTITETGNGFVMNTGGENTTSTSYRRSTQTPFKAGDVIEVTCVGRSSGDLAVIGIPRNDSACPYFADVIPSSSSVQTHYYQVKSDCKIVFSWAYANGITVKKISASYVGQILNGTVYNNADPLGKMDYAPTMISCFDKITCIGDSLTQGIFNTTTGERQVALEKYSYPTFLKKHTGVDTVNLGIGSMCASTAQDNDSWFYMAGHDPYNYLVQTNVGDAVIIALGTNDITLYSGFQGDVETDIDLNDRTQNASNSVGGYANIIQWCKEMNPKCIIFCVTIPNVRNDYPASENEKRLAANVKIRAIAEKFDCFVIDLEAYAETTLNEVAIWKTTYRNGSHNNALGYEKRARQYATYIDWIIENNPMAFQNIQFIGTNYNYVD